MGTVKKSMETRSLTWLSTKARQAGEGGSHGGHVLGDRGLSDIDAELEQLTVDSGRSPGWVGDTHPPDQGPDGGVEGRSAVTSLLDQRGRGSR